MPLRKSDVQSSDVLRKLDESSLVDTDTSAGLAFERSVPWSCCIISRSKPKVEIFSFA